MNLCSNPFAFWTVSSHALNFSGIPMVAESPLQSRDVRSHVIKNSVSNGHDRARGQQDDLLPDCSAFILTDGVDLVEYDSLKLFLEQRA